VSNKNVKQDAFDNLADALTEDILNTPDDELLREVEEDYGDRRALAIKFDQILERAKKQVSERARPSSVLDLLYRLREGASTLFGGWTPANAMVWAAPAAVLIVLILAPAVYRSMSEVDKRSEQLAALEKEQLARSEQLAAQEKELLARSEQLAAQGKELLARLARSEDRPQLAEVSPSSALTGAPSEERNWEEKDRKAEEAWKEWQKSKSARPICENVTEPFEHLICADADLEFWQHLMMEIYRHRMLQLDTNGQEILRQGQLDWLRNMRFDCNAAFQVPVSETEMARAKSCVLQSTKERVAVLTNN